MNTRKSKSTAKKHVAQLFLDLQVYTTGSFLSAMIAFSIILQRYLIKVGLWIRIRKKRGDPYPNQSS